MIGTSGYYTESSSKYIHVAWVKLKVNSITCRFSVVRFCFNVDDDGNPVDCHIYDVCVSETQVEFSPPNSPCIPGLVLT